MLLQPARDARRFYIVAGLAIATMLALPVPARAVTWIEFSYTGGPQTYVVPTGVHLLTVDMAGGSGEGAGRMNYAPVTAGAGGRVQTTLAVIPGEVLTVNVGGSGDSGGYNGGGAGGTSVVFGGRGGGATDIRRGGTALGDRILVAAGGGGGGGTMWSASLERNGGIGGGTPGETPTLHFPYPESWVLSAARGGMPGSLVAGGMGGAAGSCDSGCTAGSTGSLGSGGAGGIGNVSGGGGGGGYYGGGGGGSSGGYYAGAHVGGGGGGGSSYVGPGAVGAALTPRGEPGDGYLRLSFDVGGVPDLSPLPNSNDAPYVSYMSPSNGWEWNHRESEMLEIGFYLEIADRNVDPVYGTITVRDQSSGTVVRTLQTRLVVPGATTGDPTEATLIPGLPPGSYTWSAHATDIWGDSGPESGSKYFTILEDRPPSATLVSPLDGHVYGSRSVQTFQAGCSDPDGDPPASATYVIRDATTGGVVRTLEESVLLMYTGATPVPPLPPGSYTWTAFCEDIYGASGQQTPARSFVVQ